MLLFWAILSMIMCLAFLISCGLGLMIWTRRRNHIRERFSIIGLFGITAFALFFFATLASGLMPWHLTAELIYRATGHSVLITRPGWAEYVLFFLVYALTVRAVIQLHRGWAGLKSVEQHHLEQKSEFRGIFSEGLHEIGRIVRGESAPLVYSEGQAHRFSVQLEPVVDSLAWRDQARELLKFSSVSYAFDSESAWHDKQKCWVGRNINTGDLVLLLPTQSPPSDDELNEFIHYAHRISTEQKKPQPELIVAVRGEVYAESLKQNGHGIRLETESSLLNALVSFADYENEIRKRVLVNPLPDSTLTLNDVYVPAQYLTRDSEDPKETVEEFLIKWIGETTRRQLALLGGYGQGKSTTALMLTHHLLENKDRVKRIPILIELRGTSPRNLTPLQLLGAWASQYNMNPKALMRLHIAGKLILIFEGFDEMALVGDAEMRLKHFKTLWQFCYPNAKILITGRPNFFLDEEELKAALGISKPVADRPYCEDITLAPFNIDQIEQSLRAQTQEVKSQISDLAKTNPRFLELVSRPSLLHIVSILWKREGLYEKIDKLNSAFIMDLFVRHSYRRQGLKEFDSPDFMALNTSEREYFMSGVAAFMAGRSLPNQITGVQLNEAIDNLIQAIPDSVSTQLPVIFGETTKPLRLRLDPEYGVEHVKTDVRACGLLVDDPAAPGTFRFGHKSFMEYLFAAVLAQRIQKNEAASPRAILRATAAKIDHVLFLPVAIDFLSEILLTNDKGEDPNAKLEDEVNTLNMQRSIANRLLKTIWGSDPVRSLIGRIALLERCLHVSTTRLPWFSRFVVSFVSPCKLFILGAMLLFVSLQMSWIKTSSHERSLVFEPAMMFVGLIFLFLPITYGRWIHRRHAKSFLWNRLCNELGVQDDVLHRVVGTHWFPWVRKQKFDYFLSDL